MDRSEYIGGQFRFPVPVTERQVSVCWYPPYDLADAPAAQLGLVQGSRTGGRVRNPVRWSPPGAAATGALPVARLAYWAPCCPLLGHQHFPVRWRPGRDPCACGDDRLRWDEGAVAREIPTQAGTTNRPRRRSTRTPRDPSTAGTTAAGPFWPGSGSKDPCACRDDCGAFSVVGRLVERSLRMEGRHQLFTNPPLGLRKIPAATGREYARSTAGAAISLESPYCRDDAGFCATVLTVMERSLRLRGRLF